MRLSTYCKRLWKYIRSTDNHGMVNNRDLVLGIAYTSSTICMFGFMTGYVFGDYLNDKSHRRW